MIDAFPPLTTVALILAMILIAGVVKGSLGIGFPAVAMSLLPIIIEPALGVALLAIPIFVTNLQQVTSVKFWPSHVRRFLWAGASLAITIFLVSQLLAEVPSRWINILVGVSLSIFALSALFNFDLRVNEGRTWQICVGVTAGLLGGVSAIKAPVMIYSVALKLPRDEFIVVAGFLFFSGGTGMIGGLLTSSMLNGPTAALSGLAVIAGLAGFQVGALIRKRLSDKVFRAILLWAMLALGVRLVLVNLF